MQERQRFEEEWRNAMEGAEAAPGDHIWSNIERDLAGDAMKKRVVFYQRLAAGLLILSASLGVLVWKGYQQEETLATQTENIPTEEKASQKSTTDAAPTENRELLASANSEPQGTKPPVTNRIRKSAHTQGISMAATGMVNMSAQDNATDLSGNPSITHEIENAHNSILVASALPAPSDSTSVVVAEHTMTEEEALKVLKEYINPTDEPKEEKAALRESLWVGMGGATGSYNPNANAGGADSYRSSQLVGAGVSNLSGQTNRHEIGNAYSMGLSVGTKVSPRWIVQSGINYVNQRIDYTSNVLAFTQSNQTKMVIPEYFTGSANAAGYAANDPNNEFASVTTTDTYTINSALELISIPVQAGFMIIDRKIGWQLNSGISSDIFVRNTVVDESGRVERFQQSAGKDSPYRSVNWTGLMSTEVSYQLGEHYRLALVPGVRYYITSILKNQTSTPLILDLGFRFKYIVK